LVFQDLAWENIKTICNNTINLINYYFFYYRSRRRLFFYPQLKNINLIFLSRNSN